MDGFKILEVLDPLVFRRENAASTHEA